MISATPLGIALLGLGVSSDQVPSVDTPRSRVLEVRRRYCEISLGTEDGIAEGDTLRVYDGNRFVVRILIRKAIHDRAIGESFDNWAVRPGHHVRSR